MWKSTESDPNGITAKTPGAKLDAGKAPVMQGVIQYFPRALKAVSMVSLAGANKYAWKGWEKVPDGVNRYGDALGRHLLAETIEGPIDAGTGTLHAAQIAWNSLARLELMLRDAENHNGVVQTPEPTYPGVKNPVKTPTLEEYNKLTMAQIPTLKFHDDSK